MKSWFRWWAVRLGTGEPTVNGNGPQGEFNGLEDDSDVIALYM
nr:hypothetical protein [Providencia rettgeri]